MRALKSTLLLGLLLLTFLGVDYAISRLIHFAEPMLTHDLRALQSKQIEIYMEMNKQLLALATVVFGGAGLYFRELRGSTNGLDGRHALIWTMLLAAFSIYMGYLSYDKMVWMLSKNFFNLDTPLLYWVRTLQFWSFISSILLFGWFWLRERRRHLGR